MHHLNFHQYDLKLAIVEVDKYDIPLDFWNSRKEGLEPEFNRISVFRCDIGSKNGFNKLLTSILNKDFYL